MADWEHSLTLQDVLATPPLRGVQVETLCQPHDLERHVRWVHIADAKRTGALLKGGELLLSTGIAWGNDPVKRREMITTFAHKGAAALMLELGSQFTAVPEDVVQACADFDLPLLLLHEEIQFVQLTEAVHTLLLERKVRQITAMHEVAESFNALIVNGAPAMQILAHASRQLGCPVVLEDLSHQVVGYVEGHTLPSALLGDWGRKSRKWTARIGNYGSLTQCVSSEETNSVKRNWSMIDVQARGMVWGRVFYAGNSTCEAGGYYVLSQTAIALAMERLGSANPYSWVDLIEETAIDRLVHKKYTTIKGACEVLEASGFRTENRRLYALLFEHRGEYIEPNVYRKDIRKTFSGADFLAMQLDADPRLVISALSIPQSDTEEKELDAKLHDMGEKIVKRYDAKLRIITSGQCEETTKLASYIRSLSRLVPPPMPRAKVTVVPLSRSPLESLLMQLADDVRVQAFVSNTLEALIEHDAKNNGDLLNTLAAVLMHPASKTAAADQLHLSRTALYSRISTIERLLDVDLSNGDVIFSLSLAMKALRTQG